MLSLKVLSPENGWLGKAEALVNAAGNTLASDNGEPARAPRGQSPLRASHHDAVVTRETRPQAAHAAAAIEPNQRVTRTSASGSRRHPYER